MNMQTSTVIVAPESLEGDGGLRGKMLRGNAALWLASLVLSLLLVLPAAWRYEKNPALTLHDGRLAQDFEHYITREHPYRLPALNSWSALELSLFHSGRPGVVVGTDGWLFTAEEFPLPSLGRRHLDENIARIQTLVQELSRRGIRTVILPIPAKAELYKDRVPPHLQPHLLRLATVTAALQSRGLEWIDLGAPLRASQDSGQALFFRGETHWTPAGARLAAHTVADWIRSHDRPDSSALPPRDFVATPAGSSTLAGDLESYLPLAPFFGFLRPDGERYPLYRFSRRSLSNDPEALFGDAATRLAVVGTSYSADERWNFPGWLRVELGTDVDNISEKGKGPFAPMQRFLQQVDAGRTGVRLVVWELPVRTLAMDLAGPSQPGH